VEVDVYVWRYTLLVVHAGKEEDAAVAAAIDGAKGVSATLKPLMFAILDCICITECLHSSTFASQNSYMATRF